MDFPQSGELVDDAQQLEFGSAPALGVNEVVAPHMAREERLLRRFLRAGTWGVHLLPQAMNALDVDSARAAQERMDAEDTFVPEAAPLRTAPDL